MVVCEYYNIGGDGDGDGGDDGDGGGGGGCCGADGGGGDDGDSGGGGGDGGLRYEHELALAHRPLPPQRPRYCT